MNFALFGDFLFYGKTKSREEKQCGVSCEQSVLLQFPVQYVAKGERKGKGVGWLHFPWLGKNIDRWRPGQNCVPQLQTNIKQYENFYTICMKFGESIAGRKLKLANFATFPCLPPFFLLPFSPFPLFNFLPASFFLPSHEVRTYVVSFPHSFFAFCTLAN